MINALIGLFFLYLLLSLLATAIVEFIASWLNYRGQKLRDALIELIGKDKFKELETNSPILDNLKSSESNWLDTTKLFLGNAKRFPSFIRPKTFSDILLYFLQGGLEQDIAVIKEKINEIENEKFKTTLLFYLKEANYDIEQFKKLVTSMYDEIMDRAVGWYKRRIQTFLFILSIVIVTFLNADTLKIFTHLNQDPTSAEKVVNMAENFLNDSEKLEKVVGQDKSQKDNLDNDIKLITQNYQSLVSAQLKDAQNPLGLNENIMDEWEKEKSSSCWWWFIIKKIFGLLLTIFAISLGAPFWFDLLQKVMNVRNAGKQNVQ